MTKIITEEFQDIDGKRGTYIVENSFDTDDKEIIRNSIMDEFCDNQTYVVWLDNIDVEVSPEEVFSNEEIQKMKDDYYNI